MSLKVEVLNKNLRLKARKGSLLSDVLREGGLLLRMDCGGKGVCGRCLVEISNKNRPPLSEEEILLQKQGRLPSGFRLSCRFKVENNLEIKIPFESLVKSISVLDTGKSIKIKLGPEVKKITLTLPSPLLSSPLSFTEAVAAAIKKKNLKFTPEVLKKASFLVEKKVRNINLVLYGDREVLAVEDSGNEDKCFGIAVDLGTTTAAAQVVDLNSGRVLGTEVSANDQIKFGADVISRISKAVSSDENREELRKAAVETLNRLISMLLRKLKISSDNIYETVIAGNTAMNHLFLGVPVNTLASSPYNSFFCLLAPIEARRTGLNVLPEGRVYLAPNIKSFIGGDVSAGLTASGFFEEKPPLLYIDLGTNGEIVLRDKKSTIAASAASGPAFEGMGLNCGMPALPGAINSVEPGNPFKISTLGKKPPVGICGSGLIDLMAVLLESGKMASNGLLLVNKKIKLSEKVFITQSDIRQLQLAVGAIKTGIRMLLNYRNISFDELTVVYVAGAFGNTLNVENGKKLGLLPPISQEKIIFLGNASLYGARSLLLSSALRKKTESMVSRIKNLSLASDKKFQQHFLNSLNFDRLDSS